MKWRGNNGDQRLWELAVALADLLRNGCELKATNVWDHYLETNSQLRRLVARRPCQLTQARHSATWTCNHKGRTQCRELPLCAGSGKGCQWQALPSPVQCEETATRTRDLPVTGGKTLPLEPGPPFTMPQYMLKEIHCKENHI